MAASSMPSTASTSSCCRLSIPRVVERVGGSGCLPGMAPAVVLSCAVTDQLRIPGVPFPLAPSAAGLWRGDEGAGTGTVSAQPHTDIFIDPGNGSAGADAAVNAESMLNGGDTARRRAGGRLPAQRQ